MKILAVIPARGNNTRLVRKNLQMLDGQTLVGRAFDYARRCAFVSTAVVSTDCPETAALFPSANVVPQNGSPTSTIAEAAKLALETMEARTGEQFDAVMILQPTVPLRPPRQFLTQCVAAMICEGVGSAVTGVPVVPWLWTSDGKGSAFNSWTPDPYPRSQDCPGMRWQEINSVQITDRATVLAGKRWQLPLMIIKMPQYAVLDIDDGEDMEQAQAVFALLDNALSVDHRFDYTILRSINGECLV